MAKLKSQSDQSDVTPSPTPSPEELAAWASLTRAEQISRLRSVLAAPASFAATSETMDDLLEEARQRAQDNGKL